VIKIFTTISIIVFSSVFLCLGSTVIPAASPATATPAPTEVVYQMTNTPVPTDTPDPCLHWDEVTAAMKGQTVCVRGMITGFIQTRKVGTRYEFSKKSNTFFIFSALWEVYDTATGKTVGPGSCVEVTDVVRVQAGVPFMDIDQSIGSNKEFTGFRTYKDPSACQ
jgi:hypothetical protein